MALSSQSRTHHDCEDGGIEWAAAVLSTADIPKGLHGSA
jgi:hypothetical protein